MGLNDTPSSERIHIGFFGRRNAGKSSLVNAVTGQELSVVSDVLGTTTDPVKKAMELLPLGPVVIIDTPGFDDEGSLGELRVKRTRQMLGQSDLAVLVADASKGLGTCELELLDLIRERNIPYIIVYNKCDLLTEIKPAESCRKNAAKAEISEQTTKNDKSASEAVNSASETSDNVYGLASKDDKPAEPNDNSESIYVSAMDGTNIYELKESIAGLIKPDEDKVFLCGDLFNPGDVVLLVIPIDKAAPKGRLILPEQMVIRDVLDNDAIPVCVKENRLSEVLKKPGFRPAIVITDSQVFEEVAAIVPEDIPLTSFSILMARHKGFLKEAVNGANALRRMHESHAADGDGADCRILIAEGCTHHKQCDDIGSVKIPKWLRSYIGDKVTIDSCSGQQFPDDVSGYDLVIHCGGCMLNEREVQTRMRRSLAAGTPMTNYGIAIAEFKGILKRATAMLKDL